MANKNIITMEYRIPTEQELIDELLENSSYPTPKGYGSYVVSYINENGEVHSSPYLETLDAAHEAAVKVCDILRKQGKTLPPIQIRYIGLGQTILIESNPVIKLSCGLLYRSKSTKKDIALFAKECDKKFVERVSTTKPVVVLTLSTEYGHLRDVKPWTTSVVHKKESPLEQKLRALGGASSFIKVISSIPEYQGWTPEDEEIAWGKQAIYDDAVENGLVVNKVKFVPLGHTTNGAKSNETIWVKDSLKDEIWNSLYGEIQISWRTTCAKEIAYLVGLQAVPVEYIDLPITADQFHFFPSLISEIKDDALFVGKSEDVHEENNRIVHQNAFDGQVIMSITQRAKARWANNIALTKGITYEEALGEIEVVVGRLPLAFSMRTYGGALKGAVLVYKDGEYQDELRIKYGVERIGHTNIDDVVFFADETVLKTPFGSEGAAFNNFDSWCEAMNHADFKVGMLLKEHADKTTASSYQLTELLYGACEETLNELIDYESRFINDLLTDNGKRRLVGGERAVLAQAIPAYGTETHFQKEVEEKYHKVVLEAAEGKIHNHAHCVFGFADPTAMAAWHATGSRTGGELLAYDVIIPSAKKHTRTLVWRHPLLNIGAVKMVYPVPQRHTKSGLLKTKANVLIFSTLDTNVTRMRGDYDGDHFMWSQLEPLIDGIVETQLFCGDRLIDFDAPETTKFCISEEMRKEYFKSLVRQNDLGRNCYDLSRIYGMTPDYNYLACHQVELPETATYLVDQEAVARLDKRANINVDASKHGGINSKQAKMKWIHALSLPDAVKLHKMARESDYSDPNAIEVLRQFVQDPSNYKGNGFLDQYVREVLDCVSWEVKPVEDQFDFHTIQFSDEVKKEVLKGLYRKGNYDPNLGFAPDEGLFQNLARRTANEWQQILEDDERARRLSWQEYKALVRKEALGEIADLAQASGMTICDAYDRIVERVFTNNGGYTTNGEQSFDETVIHKGFWTIFGLMALKVAGVRIVEPSDDDYYDEF